MSVYRMSLRKKIVAALGRGETVATVARRFEVDQKTVRSYRRRSAEGTLWPRPAGRRVPVKLTPLTCRRCVTSWPSSRG